MTDTLRDLLRQDADNVEIPTLDSNHVIVQGEQRLHRRRMTAVLVGIAAVAVIAVGGIVAGSVHQHSQGPVDKPTKTDKDQRPAEPQTRNIVYSDDLAGGRVGTLHVGDREVEIDQELHSVRSWSMFVTDAGAVYAQDDRSVWFTDGGRPRKIASQACVISAGDYQSLGLATGNAGSLIAWFDCAPATRGDLVVYDTSLRREVARHPVPSCESAHAPASLPSPRSACLPDALVGQHVYVGHFNDENRFVHHQFRFDLTSRQVHRAGQRTYLEDLRTQPRTLVFGDTWQTGTATEARGGSNPDYFRPVGSRLVPVDAGGWEGEDDAPTRAFTVTGQPVRFRLPSGYQPPASDVGTYFTIFEWLDDDTLALAQGGFSVVGDIITCRLSDGRCRLAVKSAGIVPGLPLPG